MPYKLRKAPGRDLYWVVSKSDGKHHSKEPLPRARAEAQMRALYAAEGGYELGKPKGGMSCGGQIVAKGKYSPLAQRVMNYNMTVGDTVRAMDEYLDQSTAFYSQPIYEEEYIANMTGERNRYKEAEAALAPAKEKVRRFMEEEERMKGVMKRSAPAIGKKRTTIARRPPPGPSPLGKGKGGLTWIEALKAWNSTNGGKWCIPRKGTSEYEAVRKLMEGKAVVEEKKVAPVLPKRVFKKKSETSLTSKEYESLRTQFIEVIRWLKYRWGTSKNYKGLIEWLMNGSEHTTPFDSTLEKATSKYKPILSKLKSEINDALTELYKKKPSSESMLSFSDDDTLGYKGFVERANALRKAETSITKAIDSYRSDVESLLQSLRKKLPQTIALSNSEESMIRKRYFKYKKPEDDAMIIIRNQSDISDADLSIFQTILSQPSLSKADLIDLMPYPTTYFYYKPEQSLISVVSETRGD